MFRTKKDVDRHVRTALSKLHSENEKNLRGHTIAKLYFKIHEYATAQHYVSAYLSVNEEYAPAHKLLGQCLLQLKKPDKALEAFQRSLNLDPKQPDLLIEVCKMLLSDENTTSLNKVKYWCDLAESENVQHNAVFSLRLKLLNKSSLETTQIEELILKEISARPTDPNLRVRIVKHFIEENKITEAFKYAYDLEMNNHSLFANCIDWYNIVWLALSKYKQIQSSKKSWDFWLLSMICIERQVELSFTNVNNNMLSKGGTTDISSLLFTFDQYLFEAARFVLDLSPEKQLGAQFLYHFRGQLCLHAAALIYRREQVLNKNLWREATRNALPLLLFAFYCGTPDSKESWLKHSSERTRQLIQAWNREGSFRCAQAGRTILSLIDNTSNESLSSQVHSMISDQTVGSNPEDILSQVRQYCSDSGWRAKLFRILFPNSDQLVKMQSSHLVNCDQLKEPTYEMPKRSDIENYEEIAQYLKPQSLQHMVYLCIGMENLCDVKCKYYSGLNFSTQNLSFCGAESLTRLDMETFLCAATIQAQRSFEVERIQYESYNAKNIGKPRILPYANMSANLCTEAQMNWWQAAYQVYKNLAGENLAEVRSTLQYGIEAVRGINGPKIDLIIILKLGKIFFTRAQDAAKSMERAFLDARAITLYKYGLTMLKLHNKGVLEPFRKLFKYNNTNSAVVEREVNNLAEEAVTTIASRHFKSGDFEECIEELSGIQLPYATYFQAEAYRKLDESNKTPKKTKKFYCEKAKDCLDQTLQLLSFSSDKNHPLRSIVHSDMKRTHFSDMFGNDEHCNDIESREEYLNESFSQSKTHRELQTSISSGKTAELENLIKQMMTTLAFVKEELVDRIKPEVSDIRIDISMLKEKVMMIEETLKKRSDPPSRDDGTKDFDDLYIIGEDLQQVALTQYTQQQPQQAPPSQQRIQTPNALLNQPPQNLLHGASLASGTNIYNNTLYNQMSSNLPNPLMNQQNHPGQYSTPGAGSSVYNPHYNPNYPFNYYSQFVMPPGMMNMGLPSQQQQQPFMAPTESNPSLYDILSLTANTTSMNTGMEKAVVDKPPTTQATNTPVGAWNRLYNNAPVEKGPPVNVVITSSDPLPTHTTVSTQSTLSVTIPPHHIKPSLVPNDLVGASQPQANTSFPIITSSLTYGGSSTVISTIGSSVTTTQTLSSGSIFSTPKSSLPTANVLNKSNDSTDSDIHNKSTDTEYEPQVNFQPVIPLPDEVEVKTGEENEDILFSSRAKLLRLIEKEWKERGIGEIKILKGKTDGKIRILMRREQTHKTCANHYLTPEIKLLQAKVEKSFIWCADDFADEVVKREKFCVRFKQPENAKEFQKVFLQAQEELRAKGGDQSNNAPPPADKPQLGLSKLPDKPGATPGFALAKNAVFNFGTSTPKAETKSTPSAPKVEGNKPAVPAVVSNSPFSKINFGFTNTTANTKDTNTTETTKPSPFANFAFSSMPAATTQKSDSPFANIFSKTATPPSSENKTNPVQPLNLVTLPKPASIASDVATKSHTSDVEVDDYVPTAEFKPVIPLPDLVEVQTGEENEIVLFEHRAKLLRFDKSTGEWKERGIGVMKLLQDRDDVNSVRLLMRREQVFKLCCNQRLKKDAAFKYAQNSTKALTWVGYDYSESELQAEILAVRFKTPDVCKEFHSAILKAQENMTEEGESAQNGQEDSTNTQDTSKVPPAIESKAENGSQNNNPANPGEGFGDKFKPKPGSWSCGSCYTSNTPETLYCIACEEPKDDTVPKKSGLGAFNAVAPTKTTFTFGFSTPTNTPKKPDDAKPSLDGFGDKFKPKLGSWTCQGCYLQNDGDTVYCGACEAPKDDTVPKKEPATNNIFAPSSTAPKFQFGFSPTTVDSSKTTNASTSIKPVSTTTTTSTVGAPVAPQNPFDFAPKTSFIFGTPSTNVVNNIFSPSTDTKAAFSMSPSTMFGVPTPNDTPKPKSVLSKLVADLGQKSSANGDEKSNGDYNLEKQKFNFQLKPKSPGKAKSPARNLSGTVDEESAGEEDIEEENNTYFAPVIPLPDKVDVITGEENEEQLYCHRAKLYRFAAGEWKERGVGDIKILRHTETKKLRVVMRREKIHKICLNHALTPDIEYKPKDEKSWHFAANDFSEGEYQSTVFSVRFKSKEIAEGFMAAIKKVLKENPDSDSDSKETTPTPPDHTGLTDEQVKLAGRLKLPYSFFQVDDSKKCPGCRGCDPDKFEFTKDDKRNELVENPSPIPLTMPQISTHNKSILKQSVLAKPSLTSAPANGDSATPKSIFGGGSLFSKPTLPENIPTPPTTKDKFTFSLSNTKTETTQPSSFTSGGFLFGSSKTTFGSSAENAKPVFGQTVFGGENNASTSTTSSIFGGPATNATIFGGTNNSALSSTINNIFSNKTGASSQAMISAESQNNLFSNLNLKPVESQAQPAFENKSTFSFGTAAFESPFATGSATGNIFGDTLSKATAVKEANETTKDSTNKENEPKKDSNEPVFKNDPGLSFASLAANAGAKPAFKTAPEGQGGFIGLKQTGDFSIFLTSATDVENRQANTSNTSQDGSKAGQDDTAYDPHYEPIIELPELITVSTGEEHEEKIFGERGVLFRYDTTNKEWKERGTGELKILHHSEKGTYRLLLRREQIHKLVLNHAITADFQLKPMNTSGKSFCWAAMNYAENPPELERLAVRFKNAELAKRFENEAMQCVEKLKQRGAELEPEED